jgi:hypothetical protein
MFVAFFLLVAGSPAVIEPTDSETTAAMKAIVSCYYDGATALDDGTSGADVIAKAVVGTCSSELNVWDDITRRKIISIANASPGLSQAEKNRLAVSLLEDKAPDVRRKMESRAVEVVLRSRAKKNNAQD